jgi:hypothetical protein
MQQRNATSRLALVEQTHHVCASLMMSSDLFPCKPLLQPQQGISLVNKA